MLIATDARFAAFAWAFATPLRPTMSPWPTLHRAFVVRRIVAHSGYPYQSAYTASKHALLGLTKSLANEVYKDGIRVHAISPGGVYTDMVKISRPDLTGEGMISPKEIADIVEFLLKNRGNAVIDEIIVHRIGKEPFLV